MMADNSATSGLPTEDTFPSNPGAMLDSCRVCMARGTNMQPIFEDLSEDIAQKVLYCTGVIISQGDGFPTQLCLRCVQDLSVAHSFKSRCVRSDKMFQSMFSQSTLGIKVEPEDFDCDSSTYLYSQEYGCDDLKQDVMIEILKSEPDNVTVDKEILKKQPAKYMKKLRKNSKSSKSSMRGEYGRKKKVKFKKLYCEACDITFDSKKKCQQHKIVVHKESGTFVCEFCGETFSRATSHQKHLRKHLDMMPPDYCKGKFKSESSKSSENQDNKLKMKSRKLYCDACDIKFETKRESDEHKKALHNEPKIYVCEFCGKSYTNMSTHYAHVRSHQPPQYRCEHCSYMSTSKHDLAKHLRIHSGVKPYQCESCAASYHTISNLKDHSRRMHQAVVKRFQCHLCEKQFYDRTKLNRHVDSHNEVKRFICPVCHSSFTRRCYWKKHLDQKHNICLPRQRPGRQKLGGQVELELLSRLVFGDKATSIDKPVGEKMT